MFHIILVYLFLIYILDKKYSFKHVNLLMLLPLIFVVVFRFGYGADYLSYKSIYEFSNVDNFYDYLGTNTRIDLLYKLMMYPFLSLRIPFHFFFVSMNLVTLIFFYRWIADNSEDVGLSIILFYSMFFFVWVLSSVRQGLALSIGLYYVFNSRRNITTFNKLLVILALSFMHKSVLFLAPVIFVSNFKWNKKRHMAFLLISILFSFIRIDSLLNFLSMNQTFWWVMQLYNQPIKMLSLSVLMRLFFFILILIHYDKFIKDEYVSKITDAFLVGISMYFIFSFSELTASRMTIYTFMLVVLLIPLIGKPDFTNLLKLSNNYKIIYGFLVVIFSALFMQKELSALIEQSTVITDSMSPPFISIFDGNYRQFNNVYSMKLSSKGYWDKKKEPFISGDNIEENLIYSSEIDYAVVQTKVGRVFHYGVIDENGDWLIKPSVEYKELYDDILITKNKKNIFDQYTLTDLTGEDRAEGVMRGAISRIKMREQVSNGSDELIIHAEQYDNISEESLNEIFVDLTDIEIQSMSRIRNDEDYYYVAKIKYLTEEVYIYLDENFNLIFGSFILEPVKFDTNGFANIKTLSGEFLAHKSGKILWWYAN